MSAEAFIDLDLITAIRVIMLGFVGGVLSGFIGIGGAFFMTPGMMNLGIPGVIAVGSNLAQRFGKAMMGSGKHRELGHVDRKLGLFMLVSALIGIRLAVWFNTSLYEADNGAANAGAASDLYISAIYVVVLLAVAIGMLRDVGSSEGKGPSTRLAEFFSHIRIPPVVYFPTADIRVSFWLVFAVGLFTGFLAGAIGAGGFVGVPAMIYAFGVPTVVAAGTQLFLAIFMAAGGAIAYAWDGMVDLRLTVLLLFGSLSGVYFGTYGTRILKERTMRLITGLIILLCVVSRSFEVPVYLSRLEFWQLSANTESALSWISHAILYTGGIAGMAIILGAVLRSYKRRRAVQDLMRTGQ
ncbi:TSUP family transporter [candidate division GN15 bacterium]|nr:TSUP family transporter [candidate division GN15 bacterium]